MSPAIASQERPETSLTSSRSPEAKPTTASTAPPASISIPEPSSRLSGSRAPRA